MAAVDLKIDGTGFGQSTAESCWYAAYAILFNWKGTPRNSIRERIEKAGLNYTDYYRNGLPQEDFYKTRGALGLTGFRGSYMSSLSGDFDQIAWMLNAYGPIWCAFAKPSAHIVVIIGANAETDRLHILNPWNNTNGSDADSQYLTGSSFKNRVNDAVNSVAQVFP